MTFPLFMSAFSLLFFLLLFLRPARTVQLSRSLTSISLSSNPIFHSSYLILCGWGWWRLLLPWRPLLQPAAESLSIDYACCHCTWPVLWLWRQLRPRCANSFLLYYHYHYYYDANNDDNNDNGSYCRFDSWWDSPIQTHRTAPSLYFPFFQQRRHRPRRRHHRLRPNLESVVNRLTFACLSLRRRLDRVRAYDDDPSPKAGGGGDRKRSGWNLKLVRNALFFSFVATTRRHKTTDISLIACRHVITNGGWIRF